jgi:hydroxymethylpyrimidine pyrophosphatase-like HAD family hydrolase
LASSPLVNVIDLTKAITLTIGDEANDVGMIQVNIS